MHRNLGIGSWIARHARIAPDRLALVFGGQRWTYGQLDQRITQLARALAQQGVGEGDRVAFLGHNHPAALEVLFACGLLGAIAAPIHPELDEATLVQILVDASPAVLVATPEVLPRVPRVAQLAAIPRWLTTGDADDGVRGYEALIRDASAAPIDRPIGLDHTAVLAFTSGTTGRSRGVMLTHGNLFFNAVNLLTRLDYLRDDVILTSAPLYRMGGLGFLLALLLKGGTCVLQEHADPERSLVLVAEHRVTIVFDAVHAFDALQRAPSFSSADLSSLRICVTGGSYVPALLCERFRQRGIPLQPGYGLTEAAPVALLLDRDEVDAHPGAAGRPPLFVAVRIVDDALADVAPGETGELLVHGPNVMKGYWHAPRATADAFVDGGWLRTGDAARADADGTISVVGRLADALLLGGKRIHPTPIEDLLRQQPGVADCGIVQLAPDADPLVFVVPRPDQGLDRTRVLALCRVLLGAAASPRLQVVSTLPRNPNGKLLRRQLAASAARLDAPRADWREPPR